MSELIILVPTRGRPQNVAPIVMAWAETGAFADGAELIFVIDSDDIHCAKYQSEINEAGPGVSFLIESEWRPLVPKLNRVASPLATLGDSPLGFMGDDHLPRTEGWARRVLKEVETGEPVILSGPDGLRTDNLPTWWVMSANVVRALGGMVPAPVEHLYCDNSVRDVAMGASCYHWMPDLLVEHVHPAGGKVPMDDGYRRVNSGQQYKADRTRYAAWAWKRMRADVEKVNALRESHG